VVIEHSGSSHPAAAIARDLMLQTMYGGLPPLSAYPEYLRGEMKAAQDALQLRDLAPAPTPARTRA
jgi:penicillin-binding protein 2